MTNAEREGLSQAFPRPGDEERTARDGMSLRTWLAGMAMQTLVGMQGSLSGALADEVADAAVKHADTLLRRLFPEDKP